MNAILASHLLMAGEAGGLGSSQNSPAVTCELASQRQGAAQPLASEIQSDGQVPDEVLLDDTADRSGAARKLAVSAKANLIDQESLARAGAIGVPAGRSNRSRFVQANLDLRLQAHPTATLDIVIAGRGGANLQGFANDYAAEAYGYVREGAVRWAPSDTVSIRVGRINYRIGVAYGFSPTDMFRAKSIVDDVTIDPIALRESRLGTVMILGQRFFSAGSLTLAYAPRLEAAKPIGQQRTAFGLDLDRTNDRPRLLAKLSYALGRDIVPEAMVQCDGVNCAVGLNMTYGLGKSTIVYSETKVSHGRDLTGQSRDYALRTGVLSPGLIAALPAADEARARVDQVVGITVSPTPKVTVIMEYQHHGAGLTKARFSTMARNAAASIPGRIDFLHLRGFAAVTQSPIARDSLFARVAWTDAAARGLVFSALAAVTPADGSGGGQVSLSYNIGSQTTASVLFASGFGGQQSYSGSAQRKGAVSFAIAMAL